jgi:adenylate kinase
MKATLTVSVVATFALVCLLDNVSAFVTLVQPRVVSHHYQQQQQQHQTSRLFSTSAATDLTQEQATFCCGYLNQHHESLLKAFTEILSPIGAEMASANVWSGGSYQIDNAKLIEIDTEKIKLDVTVNQRNKGKSSRTVEISLNAHPIAERQRNYKTLPLVNDDPARLAIDDLVRRLIRLSWIVQSPSVTGKLVQLAIQLGGDTTLKMPDNLYLNQVPHSRPVRQYFYQQAAEAVHDAVVMCSEHKMSNRMQVIAQFPEMNPSMDSYRIGTLLELARAIVIKLAEENLRVRLCVQGSMGVGIFTGIPKQLSGVSRLMQMMDWQSSQGEDNEGMVGQYVNFGGVGKEHVVNEMKDEQTGEITQEQDDVFIILAPQSMVGTDTSIIPLLVEMVEAAGDRPVILINPDLTDKVSAAGQQSIRGRQQRIDFAQSFQTAYHFQNTYVSGTSYFPILGATTKLHPSLPWVSYQRRDYADGGEIYIPVLAKETMPTGEDIMAALER